MDEYPKWINEQNVIVQNRAEEDAVLNISRDKKVGGLVAVIGVLKHSAEGDTLGIVGYKPIKEKK